MRIGIGLGLTNQRGGPSSSPEDTIKAAIKERKHVRAMRGETSILVQPYALYIDKGTRVLHAVIVAVDGEARGDWVPSGIDMSDLSDVEVYDDTFVPSDAFDADALDGVIAVVEGFDPFKDVSETDPDGT